MSTSSLDFNCTTKDHFLQIYLQPEAELYNLYLQ